MSKPTCERHQIETSGRHRTKELFDRAAATTYDRHLGSLLDQQRKSDVLKDDWKLSAIVSLEDSGSPDVNLGWLLGRAGTSVRLEAVPVIFILGVTKSKSFQVSLAVFSRMTSSDHASASPCCATYGIMVMQVY